MIDRRRLIAGGATLFGSFIVSPVALLAAGNPGLTTHMLDVMNGKPAEGVAIDFSVLDGGVYKPIKTVRTTADGRAPEPLLNADTIKVGKYQLVFHIADYFTKLGTVLPDPPFLETAVIQFGIADAKSHYHVPLLASPWTFTTYRGS